MPDDCAVPRKVAVGKGPFGPPPPLDLVGYGGLPPPGFEIGIGLDPPVGVTITLVGWPLGSVMW